ncbi:MAG: hypothetical protein ACREDY_18775 [Bradyrhizobium sp.]
MQVLERRLRFRRDASVEALLESLGAKVAAIEAPFEPEGGAYDTTGAHHDHHHDHAPDHGHHHHDHDHHDDHHHHDHKHD